MQEAKSFTKEDSQIVAIDALFEEIRVKASKGYFSLITFLNVIQIEALREKGFDVEAIENQQKMFSISWE